MQRRESPPLPGHASSQADLAEAFVQGCVAAILHNNPGSDEVNEVWAEKTLAWLRSAAAAYREVKG